MILPCADGFSHQRLSPVFNAVRFDIVFATSSLRDSGQQPWVPVLPAVHKCGCEALPEF